jgi:tRNA threonylcarbamoyladenosine biosynthesis protein TsaE
VKVPTADAMYEFGRRLATELEPGDLVLLIGPLGAGKTTLAQGIGAGLGVSNVVSPTFVIARVHRGGRLPLVHVDAYRLSSIEEVDDLDLDAWLPESVTLVEWGKGLVEGLATDRLEIHITRDDETDQRAVEVVGIGERWLPAD